MPLGSPLSARPFNNQSGVQALGFGTHQPAGGGGVALGQPAVRQALEPPDRLKGQLRDHLAGERARAHLVQAQQADAHLYALAPRPCRCTSNPRTRNLCLHAQCSGHTRSHAKQYLICKTAGVLVHAENEHL